MSAVRDAILAEIGTMGEARLADVLAAIRANADRAPTGMTGSDFVRQFGGLIPVEEMDRMDAAIERDCETVEPDHGA